MPEMDSRPGKGTAKGASITGLPDSRPSKDSGSGNTPDAGSGSFDKAFGHEPPKKEKLTRFGG